MRRIHSGVNRTTSAGTARACLLAIVVTLAVSVVVNPVTARAAAPFEVQVSAGYDNFARQDDWTPVRVTVRNNGGDFRGTLRVDDANNAGTSTGFGLARGCCGAAAVGYADRRLSVSIPAGSTRHFTVFLAGSQTPRATLLEGGNAVASGQVAAPLVTTDGSTVLVGVVSDQADSLDHLGLVHAGGQAATHVFHLRTADLPESGILLRSFDVIAFDNASTDTLTPAQRNALADYVGAGGGLLLVGGPLASRTLAGIPAELQPVRLTGTARSDLGPVAGLATAALPAGGAEVSTGSLTTGTLAVTGQGTPLLAWLRHGKGTVVYTAFDAGAEPITSWSGERTMLRQLLGRAGAVATSQANGPKQLPVSSRAGGLDYNAVSTVLTNLPSLDLPSVALVGWLLLTYALVVGPLNYLLLKRVRRRHLGWLTIPMVVVVASVGVLAVGLNIKGVGTQVNQVRVVQSLPGSTRQYVVSFSGVVVPHRGDYSLSLPGDSQYGSLPNLNGSGDTRVAIIDDPPHALLQGMTAYSVRGVAAEGFAAAAGAVQVDVSTGGNRLTGTVTNNTGRDIEDAVVLYAGGYQQLGVLRAGQAVPISVSNGGGVRNGDLASLLYPSVNTYNTGGRGPQGNTSVDREEQRRAQVIRGLTGNVYGLPTPTELVGFQAGATGNPTVDGNAVQVNGETAVVVPITPAPGRRATAVRAGEVNAHLVDLDGNAQAVPTGASGITTQVSGGSATVEFDLPGGGWQQASVANVGTGVPVPCLGVNGTGTVVGPGTSAGPTNSGGPGALPVAPAPVIVPAPVPAQGCAPVGAAVVSVYNFSSGTWDTAARAADGRVHLQAGAGEVSPDGVVLVRYAAAPGSSVVVSGADITASRPAPL